MSSQVQQHVAQQDESLVSIALRYNMEMDELLGLNYGLSFWDSTYQGQIINVIDHTKASSSSSNTTNSSNKNGLVEDDSSPPNSYVTSAPILNVATSPMAEIQDSVTLVRKQSNSNLNNRNNGSGGFFATIGNFINFGGIFSSTSASSPTISRRQSKTSSSAANNNNNNNNNDYDDEDQVTADGIIIINGGSQKNDDEDQNNFNNNSSNNKLIRVDDDDDDDDDDTGKKTPKTGSAFSSPSQQRTHNSSSLEEEFVIVNSANAPSTVYYNSEAKHESREDIGYVSDDEIVIVSSPLKLQSAANSSSNILNFPSPKKRRSSTSDALDLQSHVFIAGARARPSKANSASSLKKPKSGKKNVITHQLKNKQAVKRAPPTPSSSSVSAAVYKHSQQVLKLPQLLNYNASAPSLLAPLLVSKLNASLPRRLQNHNWRCLFTTLEDGISLLTFFQKAENVEETILVIKTASSDNAIIGVFNPEQWHQSSKFYGTGECFIFSFIPENVDSKQANESKRHHQEAEFNCYKWTRFDQMFISSTIAEGIRIGSATAMSIDSDFRFGVSHSSNTFGSPRLTREEDFEIVNAELWAIDSSYSKVIDNIHNQQEQKEMQQMKSLLIPQQPHRELKIRELHSVEVEGSEIAKSIIKRKAKIDDDNTIVVDDL